MLPGLSRQIGGSGGLELHGRVLLQHIGPPRAWISRSIARTTMKSI
jgi:hypothetical protein